MRDELETEQNCNILTPTLVAITAFLSRSPGLLNRWPGGQASLGHGPHSCIFFPTNSNFLCTELYYCFTSTQFNLPTVKVIPLIPSTGFTCYLHRCISYFDSSAGVNMQQSSHNYFSKFHMWNFLLVRLHPPLTHILQNNSPGQQCWKTKNTKRNYLLPM